MGEKSDKLSNKDIVIYALYLLGGRQKRVHTEDVALKCYQFAPSKFSWVKYPQHPDLASARFMLEAAKKPKNGALVIGETERKRPKKPRSFKELLSPDQKNKKIGGWMLTGSGIQWIEANKDRIEKYLGEHKPIGDRLHSDRKLKELFRSEAFRKFSNNREQAEISHAEFAESLVCTVNTGTEVLNDRLTQLYSTGKNLKREEVKNYVNFCRKKFASLLGEKEGEKNVKI